MPKYQVIRIRADGAHVIHESNCQARAWQIFAEIVHPASSIVGFWFNGRLLAVIGLDAYGNQPTGRKYYNSPRRRRNNG